ncbi:MAG: ABC transporter permease [Puia sp.]|nr:ABC transporter permease [Puia sp.]
MLKNYFKIAWRNLRNNKVYSFINIAGLALGLACTILIALWIKDERSYDRFHANGDRLYRVLDNVDWGTLTTGTSLPMLLNPALKKDMPEIKYASTLSDDNLLLTAGNTRYKEKGCYVTDDFLHMFSFPLLKGDVNTALSPLNGIVISQRTAHKYFGNEDPIGKIIKVDNTDPFVVTAVLKDIPANSSLQFDWLIPFEYHHKKNPWLDNWGNYASFIYVQLAPGASLGKVNAKLQHFMAKTRNDNGIKDELFLQSFGDAYLHGNYNAGKPAGGRIEYVRLFSIIAVFVLLIACINFMNLSTARSSKRAKEVGIRKVIGAERKFIVLQFLGESLLLTLFSVVLALFIVALTLPAFSTIMGKQLSLKLSDPAFIMAAILITLVTSLVSGSYPAFFLSSFKPVQVLKSAVIKSGNANLFRKGLVVFQFALSILLIVGTLIVSQQIGYIRNKNIGMDKEHLLTLTAEGGLYEHLDAFQNELSQSPGIAGVTVIGQNPIAINSTSADLDWSGKPPKQVVSISATAVGYDFLKTLGVPLVDGRDFSRTRPDSNSYIINESAARLMSLKNPIGQIVKFWAGKGPIIGVVKDFHLHSLHEAITPLILTLQPGNVSLFMVRTEKGKTQEAVTSLQSMAQKYNPAYPFEYHFLDELYEQTYKSEMIVGKLVRIFAVMAILISCLGLFGLATFTAEQRIKEIGIRKVLGASVSGIAALLSKEFLRLVFIALVIASPIAWWAANNWLSGFVYRISIGWQVFVLAGLAAILIALVTVSSRAIKAALSNPVKALRSE